MTLRQLIKKLKLSGTAKDIATALNSKTVEIKDNTPRTYDWIAREHDSDFVAAIDSALKAAGLDWMRMQLAGTGIDFSHPKTIAKIKNLAAQGVITTDQATKLEALGTRYISPYEQHFGEGTSVAEEMVAAALAPPVVHKQERIATIRSDGNKAVGTVQIHEIYKDGTRVITESFTSHDANTAQKALLDQLIQILNSYSGG